MAFSTQRRVEFRDTDAAGIVHFSVFFPLMESAEHEMLRSLGIAVLPQEPGGLTWPRVAAACNYTTAARFEDLLRVSVRVAKLGTSSVQYEFEFSRDGAKIATGTMTAVCCTLGKNGLKKAVIPDEIRQLLSEHQ